MNFEELGQTLQQEREAKGLTIEAVMEATKISRVNLVALESGDSSTLPHPVYTKGFIRSYARLLELDADELSMVVDREYRSEDQEVEEVAYDVSPAAGKAFQEGDTSSPGRKKRSVWPSILAFVAVAVIGVLVVLNLNKSDVESTQGAAPAVEQAAPAEAPAAPVVEEQAAPAAEEEPVTTAEEPETTAVEEQAAPAAEEQATLAEQPDEAPAVTEPSEQAVPAEQAQEPAAEATVPTPATQAATPDEPTAEATATDEDAEQEGIHYDHVLIIRATTDKGCWIGLWKGDEPNMARDFVLKKGEPLRLMFNSPRRIRIGNVAGVVVTYNGQPYQLEKNKSNIQTLVFGAD